MKYDKILYGSDSQERIVGLHLEDQWVDDPIVVLYIRDKDGTVRKEYDTFYPFFFINDLRLLRPLCKTKQNKVIKPFKAKKLKGDNHYKYLVAFDSLSKYWQAIKYLRFRFKTEEKKDPDCVRTYHNPIQQYLIQSGKTLFKGMGVSDIRRMQIDIEVYTEHSFPNAEREEDQIIIVSCSDNTGWEAVIHLDCGIEINDSIVCNSESDLLKTLKEIIVERDPDVIEGHNFLGFDLPYIARRCSLRGVRFGIGRDGSIPDNYERSRKFAERYVDFNMFAINGRSIIDTYFLVMDYDAIKRDMNGHGLKSAAKYFGVAREDRVYIDGSKLSETWNNDPAKILEYALDDVRETRSISERLSGATFYLTQIVPMNYDSCDMAGPSSRIESIFVREYLRQGYSIPKPEEGRQKHGGYTDIFVQGVVGPVVYADVSSLYPSIMLNYNIEPKGKDPLNLFKYTLSKLTDLRLEAKADLKKYEKDSNEYQETDGRQSAYKIQINSYYGMLGFANAAFNDFSEADRVATTGQDILKLIIHHIEKGGGEVIEADTDGVLFIPPFYLDTEDKQKDFVRSLTNEMPDGIEIDHDGSFKKMVSYKKKNYALMNFDGTIKYKGSSIISRSLEKFGRDFVSEGIKLLMNEDIDGLHKLYIKTYYKILNRDWDDVNDFSTTTTLNDSIDIYLEKIELGVGNGGRNRDAAYELAIKDKLENNKKYLTGDKITYYIYGSEKAYKVSGYEWAKFAHEWDADKPDENTEYYIKKRFKEFIKKFKPFFEESDYDRIFELDNPLFKFDFTTIKTIKNNIK